MKALAPLVMLCLLFASFLLNKRGHWFRTPGGTDSAVKQPQASASVSDQLHHPDWRVRLAAVEALAEADAATAIPRLADALSDLDHDVRTRARDGLVGFWSMSVPVLLAALEAGNLSAREQAAAALGHIGDPAAVSGLGSALQDESAWVRRQAAESLGLIGGDSAVPLLTPLLKDEDSDVRHAASVALDQIASAQAGQ